MGKVIGRRSSRATRIALVAVVCATTALAGVDAGAATRRADRAATAERTAGDTARRSDAGGAACRWSIASAPDPRFAYLQDIDGTAANDIWAVGARDASGGPLIMHWNGRRWSTVAAPDPGNLVALAGVDAVSRNNAWAVGFFHNGIRLQTFILHWNGVRWSRTPSPSPRTGDNLLFDVVAAGPDKAWAVGTDNLNASAGNRTIILRWNGRRWVDDHPTATEGNLSGVAHRSGTVFAVGGNNNGDPLVERRTANGWVNAQITSDETGVLFSADAAGSGPFRGVGERSGAAHTRTFAMNSAGLGWVDATTPNNGRFINQLFDVSARSANEAWAVGLYETPAFVNRTLAMRFANGDWSLVSTPNPNRRNTELHGVFAVPRSRIVWAVGLKSDAVSQRPLVMRFHC